MYIHTLACFCESQRCFFSLLSLKYITYFFSVCLISLYSLPAAVSPLLSPRRAAIRVPLSSLPSCLPSLIPSAPVCCVCRGCRVCPVVSPSVSPSPLLVPSCLLCVRPEALRRPSVAAVTRQPSGAKQCGSVGRCTAYMSPAFCPPLVYVLPCVPSLVPWLVLLPAACCRLVVVTAGTPQYPGRRQCGAASVM